MLKNRGLMFVGMSSTTFVCKMNVKSKEEGFQCLCFSHHVNTWIKKIIDPLMQTFKYLYG
jgi:hypothetical protein